MNTDTNNTKTIVYNEDIISKIKEMIEKGLNKLESFIKSKTKLNLKFYHELDCEFDEISSKLEELELWEEIRYFLSIKRMILYIVRENSFDRDFGHCNFALELLNFFIEMFKTNVEFYKKESALTENYFKDLQNEYKIKYRNYRRVYYQTIHKTSERYSEEELYETLKGLRK